MTAPATPTELSDLGVAVGPTRRTGVRFLVAFLAGLIAVLALGAGALYGYDRQFEGRILPGVRVGGVDLSGLGPDAARGELTRAYAGLGVGEIVLTAGKRTTTITYASIGRRLDVDGLVDEALGVGRAGSPLERAIGNAKTALRGVTLEPRLVFDADALAAAVEKAAAREDRDPVDATVTVTKERIAMTEGSDGALADRRTPLEQALAAVAELDAPARIDVAIPIAVVEPRITTAEATAAKQSADAIAKDLDITVGDDIYTIKASTVRTWFRVSPTVDGAIVPVLHVTKIPATINTIAKKVKLTPKNASFLVGRNNQVVGVTAGRNGRTMNVAATTALVRGALEQRADRKVMAAVAAKVTITKPTLTTAEAEKAAPLMKKISSWTTYFPITIKNGFGANIWIPAEDIDGYVVGPGEWFDFWQAVGPVTRARGYRDGGAIINGRTEPQGALAGGICSCSTTLFNAALRAGFQMGARRNHYYYIDRYPLGLDATVFKSGSGSVQTMSWRNDTDYPVLIRGLRIRDGSAGYVRFDLYSIPTGRRVTFSRPIVRNFRPAGDSVQYTSSLAPGARQRIEYPVDGKDVWVTRTVRDARGRIVHQETYYSHYARVTGIVLVGR